MLKTRVIPCLLLKDLGLVKTVRFSDPKYVGDPINAVKIFNNKEVDELIFLDISATAESCEPNFELLAKIATEAFMPFSYGGGIKTLETAKKVFELGSEKVIINAYAHENPDFITELASKFGSQSVVASMDVLKGKNGNYSVFKNNGKIDTGKNPVKYAIDMEKMGAGEIFLNSINNDGVMEGYDEEIIKEISASVSIPIIACGGAGNLEDFKKAKEAGASAVSAGSLFVFIGKNRSVLISYPSHNDLKKILN